jgi:hypothetical protein
MTSHSLYKGRTITIESAGAISREDNLFDAFPASRDEFKRVVVNGSAQFGFQGDDRFVRAETERYIDAVDAAAERSRQKAAAGGYTSGRNTDFAESWNRS